MIQQSTTSFPDFEPSPHFATGTALAAVNGAVPHTVVTEGRWMRFAAAFNAAAIVSVAFTARLGLAFPPVWRDCAFVPSLGASRWLALGDNPNGANEAGDRAKQSQQDVKPKLPA